MSKSSKRKKKQQKSGTYQLSLFDKRRGGQPGNTNALKHGLYSPRFAPDEIEGLSQMEDGLKDEIKVVRVQLKRIMDYIEQFRVDGQIVMKPEDYAAMLNLITKNAATVGRLMQIDKSLTDAANVGIQEQLLTALEEVNESLSLQ